MTTVDALSSLFTTTSTTSTTSASETSTTALDADAFLELFLVQLQNQDPLDPMDTDDMSNTLCNYSQLEELMKSNESLASLIQYQQSICNSQAVQLIGKDVVAEGNEIIKADGATSDILLNLEQSCDSLTVSIFDSDGELVKTIDAEDLDAGLNTLQWDGTDEDGNEVDDGTYTFTAAATGSSSQTITTYGTYSINSVVSNNGQATLIADSGTEVAYEDVCQVMASLSAS